MGSIRMGLWISMLSNCPLGLAVRQFQPFVFNISIKKLPLAVQRYQFFLSKANGDAILSKTPFWCVINYFPLFTLLLFFPPPALFFCQTGFLELQWLCWARVVILLSRFPQRLPWNRNTLPCSGWVFGHGSSPDFMFCTVMTMLAAKLEFVFFMNIFQRCRCCYCIVK